MASNDKIILPEKYYLDNFRYLLDFVMNKYDPLLSQEEKQFIDTFQQLSEDGQCLYVRLSNRKGQFFQKEKLNYVEINDLDAAHRELLGAGLVVRHDQLEIDELYQLLSIYNKPEIIKITQSAELPTTPSLKKDELILELIETATSEVLQSLFYKETIVTQGAREVLDMIKLFFFGHNHGDMSDFVIRDVGHARFMEIDESQLGTSFDSREEAEAVMQLSLLHKEFYLLEETAPPLHMLEWFQQVGIEYFLSLEKARRRAEKLIHKVGYHLERNKYPEEALLIYYLSNASPLRERRIRIYNRQKEYDRSLQLARQIIESPNDNKEYYIALDVINKLDKKLKNTTLRQKEGLVVPVLIDYKHRVEQGALAYFESQGFQGCHAENSICRNIFGLFFWDEIFDPQYNSLHQPLQRNPSDLYGKDFYEKRKHAILHKLDKIKSRKPIYATLKKSIEAYDGIANPFVHWEAAMLDAMWQFLARVRPGQIKALLAEMAIDPKNRSTGFPDLLVWNDSTYRFYEVKSPNDHLSENQLFWLEKFDEWKIKAEIALVEWVE